MCAPSPPPAPDYEAAARATAEGDLENARLATLANRPNVFSPQGSQTWTQDPENVDKWTQTITLNPEAQKAFESSQRIQTGLGGLGEQAIGSVGNLFKTRYETPGEVPQYQGQESPLPTYGENRQRVMDAMLSRVDTDIARDRDRKSAQLIASGIPPGSEAYQRQMEQIDRQLTDARQQAEIAAQQMAGQEYASALQGRQIGNQENMAQFTTGLDTRRQGITEALAERQNPLNEINAFRSGSQVAQPQFQSYGQQPFTGGPDIFGATTAQGQYAQNAYNQQVAGQNALTGGLFGLGAGALGSGMSIPALFGR